MRQYGRERHALTGGSIKAGVDHFDGGGFVITKIDPVMDRVRQRERF